ncbi:hypothetical protein FQN57_005861 [Myotisia sp. PD_48]|nr:hypothetical protein FQN57_005861 [Myotisia sp. PD_48]
MGFMTVNRTVPVDNEAINKAFEEDTALQQRVLQAISQNPSSANLFEDIAKFIHQLQEKSANIIADRNRIAASFATVQSSQQVSPSQGTVAKKRKIQNDAAPATDAALTAGLNADTDLQIYVQDMSFVIPQRKKLRLELTRGTPGGREFLRARNQASNEIEFGVPLAKIQHILCLPVPEKAQRQYNFCVIPEYRDGITAAPEGVVTFEPLVWTVPDAPPRTAFLGSGTPVMEGASLAETNQSYLISVLNEKLKNIKVIQPDANQFVSAKPEAHRKTEKAYHVRAFRGSKEGYLFFLSTGIFFGFKKPVIFCPFANIESISYTSVLQRTFNLNIATRSSTKPDEIQELEFSMIDQADYPGIDAYSKKHRLQDASMAEQRRAKMLNINAPRGGEDEGQNGDGNASEEESELQKAQRELERQQANEEDEEGEDFDPGSDGDTDGSGSSSEEDDDEMEQGPGYDVQGRDLVKDELGSEAEDVEID